MAGARKYINCSPDNIINGLQNRTDMVRLHQFRGGGGGGLEGGFLSPMLLQL